MDSLISHEIQWETKSFDKLSLNQLYRLLAERQAIFVVEQNCPFQDADGLDQQSWHIMGTINNQLVAYARIVFPGARFVNPSIGRIITISKVRGTGLGKLLMKEAIRNCNRLYPGRKINLSAQIQLESFYNLFGFKRISGPYDEDGIVHIDMEKY